MSREHNQIVKPVVTEKSTIGRETENRYVFEVRIDATKPEIKKAVERLFNVKVESVNSLNQTGKMKRVRHKPGMTSTVKKAVIKLKQGNSIKIFEGK